MKKYAIPLLIGVLLSTQAAFGQIKFGFDAGGTWPAGAKEQIEAEINKLFQVPNMGGFLESMSNAQSLSNKGQGVAYASEQSLFVVGGGFGVGLNAPNGLDTKFNTDGLPSIGLGAQGSIMVGVSLAKLPVPALGPIDLKRLTVFVNYFGISNDSIVDSMTIKANTFGVHVQYKLMQGFNLAGLGILNWGGLAVTTGFDVSSNSLTYKVGKSIDAGDIKWTPNTGSNLSLDSSAFTIPIEISTSVRLAYILSLFGGVGVDLNFGKTSISSNLSGPVTGNYEGNFVSGAASLTGSEEKGPTFGDMRFFIGPQINIVPLRTTNVVSLYAQFNVATSGNYGFHTGLRIAW